MGQLSRAARRDAGRTPTRERANWTSLMAQVAVLADVPAAVVVEA
jgi:hypothetical protein